MEIDNSVPLTCVETVVSAVGSVFLCAQCNTVLGDSRSVCGDTIDSIMCLRTTHDVVVSDEVELGHQGEIAKCIYSSLKCFCCDSAVGIVIHSAPSRLASIRSLFLLHKANINCYILGSQSVVKAYPLSLDMKPLGPKINKVMEQFTALLEHMTQIKRRLDNCSVNSSSDR